MGSLPHFVVFIQACFAFLLVGIPQVSGHGIPPLLQSLTGNFTFSSNPTGAYAVHAEFKGHFALSTHEKLAVETHVLSDGSVDILLNRFGADGRIYHYKKNETTGVERCRAADSPNAPHWEISKSATLVGTQVFKDEQELHFKHRTVASTWRVVAPVVFANGSHVPMWYLQDKTVGADAPHEAQQYFPQYLSICSAHYEMIYFFPQDIMHMLYAARSPSGPWERGLDAVTVSGFGFGDLPGEWVSRRTLKVQSRNSLDAALFAIPPACRSPVPWQNSGTARHFMAEIA